MPSAAVSVASRMDRGDVVVAIVGVVRNALVRARRRRHGRARAETVAVGVDVAERGPSMRPPSSSVAHP
jgi:hypothetical protein